MLSKAENHRSKCKSRSSGKTLSIVYCLKPFYSSKHGSCNEAYFFHFFIFFIFYFLYFFVARKRIEHCSTWMKSGLYKTDYSRQNREFLLLSLTFDSMQLFWGVNIILMWFVNKFKVFKCLISLSPFLLGLNYFFIEKFDFLSFRNRLDIQNYIFWWLDEINYF